MRTVILGRSKLEGKCKITAFDGSEVVCNGLLYINMAVGEEKLRVQVITAENMIAGFDVILGMDVITQLGGVRIDGETVKFGNSTCAVGLMTNKSKNSVEGCVLEKIEDKDFSALFDGKKWIAKWVWKKVGPPVLRNRVPYYDNGLEGPKREAYEAEVERWIEDGILVPWEGEEPEGIIALMATEQPTKNKVRPVLDFRELNKHIECQTGDGVLDVCSDRLREWRQIEGHASIVDLQAAYLQIGIDKDLWKYQIVQYKDKMYCLTRLGFGLNSAPRIMSKILKFVLSKDKSIDAATSSYIDDIIVDESKLSSESVVSHLSEYGLKAKDPQPLAGGSALGLKISKDPVGNLSFKRGNVIANVPEKLSRRELFSICGKLVGHYPVADWLRVACSYIKRCAEGNQWEDDVGVSAHSMLVETVERVKLQDPVKGAWYVPKSKECVVWCDASNLAHGVLLEIDGAVVEDGSWLRKKNDYNHINVAELDAIMKGVNMAIKWGTRSVKIITDSATVYTWVTLTITEEKKIKTKGAAEIIVKRRLGILRNLIDELGLKLEIILVPSEKNKADALTRVPLSWIKINKTSEETRQETACIACETSADVRESHNQHHMGIDRSLFLARKIEPSITRDAVKRVVQTCERCQSIDPAPVSHTEGRLGVEDDWKRAAIDITHYKGVPYLTLVDCGPGRFAMWRALTRETAECIKVELAEIFMERGPLNEVLMDNGTAFHSECLTQFFYEWNVNMFFRAAYRASGNGIVERNHRTVKRIAERGGIDPRMAVFWYNSTPRQGQNVESVPHLAIYRYEWRHPDSVVEPLNLGQPASIRIGDEVWVKPPDKRCTSLWKKGVVTNINSSNNVSVDNMPRHILDIRRVINEEQHDSSDEVHSMEAIQSPSELPQDPEPRYPRRDRRPPEWAADYEM